MNVDASKLLSVDNSPRVQLGCKQVQPDSTKFSLQMTWLGSGINSHLQWCSVTPSIHKKKKNLTTITSNKVSDMSTSPRVL